MQRIRSDELIRPGPVLVLSAMLSTVLPMEAMGEARARLPPDTRNPHIPIAAERYSEYDYDSAMASLADAITWSGNRRSDTEWIGLMEGVVFFYLGNENAALRAFDKALRENRA